jgi:hypothetical protein
MRPNLLFPSSSTSPTPDTSGLSAYNSDLLPLHRFHTQTSLPFPSSSTSPTPKKRQSHQNYHHLTQITLLAHFHTHTPHPFLVQPMYICPYTQPVASFSHWVFDATQVLDQRFVCQLWLFHQYRAHLTIYYLLFFLNVN